METQLNNVSAQNEEVVRQFVHDLRSPLSIIAMGMELIDSLRTDESQFQEMTTMMKDAVEDLQQSLRTFISEPDCGHENGMA